MKSKTVWDSGFHTVDSGFQVVVIPVRSVELGFQMPIVSGISVRGGGAGGGCSPPCRKKNSIIRAKTQ